MKSVSLVTKGRHRDDLSPCTHIATIVQGIRLTPRTAEILPVAAAPGTVDIPVAGRSTVVTRRDNPVLPRPVNVDSNSLIEHITPSGKTFALNIVFVYILFYFIFWSLFFALCTSGFRFCQKHSLLHYFAISASILRMLCFCIQVLTQRMSCGLH